MQQIMVDVPDEIAARLASRPDELPQILAKGSDVGSINAETGEYIRLYHPRRDRWVEHFQIDRGTGEILGISAVGRVTVRLLQMNRVAYWAERLLLLQAGVLVLPRIVD